MHWARSIKPKFPEILVQNQMERNISKTLFRKFRSTSRGCPVFRKLGNTGNSLFIWHSIVKSICPTARAGSWLAILHKNANICFLGAMSGRPCGFPTGMRPVWITPMQRT